MRTGVASVAVVGAGLAGATAVRTLREQGFSGRVTLIGGEPHLPYERPPLSKAYLTAGAARETLQVHPPEFYAAHDIEVVLGRAAARLVPGRGVELVDGTVAAAERVLLCTGLRPRRLPVSGAALTGVLGVRDLEDAERLRDAVARGGRTVVVGEGFVGSEVAATLAGLGAEVTLLMGTGLPVQPALGPEAGAWLLARHRASGIDVRERSPIRAILGAGQVESVELADGTVLPADTVVIAVGSAPNADLAADAGIRVQDGVLVDERGRTSHPGVYAAGDVARFPSATFGGTLRVEHWQHAQQHAAGAARAVLGGTEAYDRVPWAWSEQHGHRFEIAGLPWSGGVVRRRGDPDSAEGALWITVRDGRVVGAVSVNRRRELRAVLRALGRGPVTVDEHALLDPDADLPSLLTRPATT
ncbi:FAD-dependent oxidoreductase [Pseudonocardia sp. KRD-184]|uniref:FAD-dependent oxidoreductase n=1 Tax=Pseudonocardia oceani TaxID=2792013 RepID=A0ABS6U2B6_9PSEU|nr:FAD-dependent oxidoreductase [Pseudonocardia oceani]MBW0088150.1 FAD-dependent oxidoreductase [Pseudonocardia oceani]MBW0095083.1 FAD-dependent oxidoreductase [Pseudonocardia oceani]MBW0107180.1 FAD-dependent oxidoreductase [Pseudonocardia oceani]MBW0119724.1 FAD-dependent oxidoreductase [Pseudonocardia oceani]MBW0126387.1 FAD-dependent oxidoreductase [Pseudonocardia oceani]